MKRLLSTLVLLWICLVLLLMPVSHSTVEDVTKYLELYEVTISNCMQFGLEIT